MEMKVLYGSITSQTAMDVDQDSQSQNSTDTLLRIAQALGLVLDDQQLPEVGGSNTEDEGLDVFSGVEHAESADWSNISQTAIDVGQDSQSQNSSDTHLSIAQALGLVLDDQKLPEVVGSNTEDEGLDVFSGVEHAESADWSNISQTAIDVGQDSQSQNSSDAHLRIADINYSVNLPAAAAAASGNPAVMTRSQQRKTHQCSVCPRSFMTDKALQSHQWRHWPKENGHPGKSATMVHKNEDLQDRQVYSSNGVQYTAQPYEYIPQFWNVDLQDYQDSQVYSSNGVQHTAQPSRTFNLQNRNVDQVYSWNGAQHTAQPSVNIPLLKHECHICGEMISNENKFMAHLEVHRVEGQYVCDICRRVFKSYIFFNRHKAYHARDKFLCDVCGRKYPTSSALRAHMVSHSDQRPFPCPMCDKSFKRTQDLKFHINHHTGARPYKCPYCPLTFASSGNSSRHQGKDHAAEFLS